MQTATTSSAKVKPCAGHDSHRIDKSDDAVIFGARDEAVRPCPARRHLSPLPANPTGPLAGTAYKRPTGRVRGPGDAKRRRRLRPELRREGVCLGPHRG